jgi:predicted Rossmann-fold nucleotide-binding protein
MAFHMQALVVAPGGLGTCDEMFEIMTLKQTGKMQSGMPIVLLGKAYWKRVINWDAFKDAGVINQRDVDELLFTDDVDEAFDFLVNTLGAMTASPEV